MDLQGSKRIENFQNLVPKSSEAEEKQNGVRSARRSALGNMARH